MKRVIYVSMLVFACLIVFLLLVSNFLVVSDGDLITAAATIFTGFAALTAAYAAWITIQTMRETHKEQIQNLQQESRLQRYNSLIAEKENLLKEWATEIIPPPRETTQDLILKYITQNGLKSTNYWCEYDFNNKIGNIINLDTKTKTGKVIHFSNAFEYLKNLVDQFDEDTIKKQYLDPNHNFYELRAKLESYSLTYTYLVILIRDAINFGYDHRLATTILSTSYEASSLLFQIGAIDRNTIKLSRFITALGQFGSSSININLKEKWLTELQEEKLLQENIDKKDIKENEDIDKKTLVHTFSIETNSIPKEFFIRKEGVWSKTTKQ